MNRRGAARKLARAAERGDLETLDKVLALWPEAPLEPAYDAVRTAVRYGQEAALERLLEAGVGSGAPDLMDLAVARRNGAIAERLVRHGVDYHAWHAAALGWTARLAALLDRRPELVTADRDGYTLLHLAAAAHQPETVSLLLERGASRDARSPEGKTPLELSHETDGGSAPIAQLLGDSPQAQAAQRTE